MGGGCLLRPVTGFLILLRRGGTEPMWRPLPEGASLMEQNVLLGGFVLKILVQRWVMAVWLVRAVDEVPPAAVVSSRFVDVETGEW